MTATALFSHAAPAPTTVAVAGCLRTGSLDEATSLALSGAIHQLSSSSHARLRAGDRPGALRLGAHALVLRAVETEHAFSDAPQVPGQAVSETLDMIEALLAKTSLPVPCRERFERVANLLDSLLD